MGMLTVTFPFLLSNWAGRNLRTQSPHTGFAQIVQLPQRDGESPPDFSIMLQRMLTVQARTH